MPLRIGPFEYRATLWPSLVTTVLLALLLSLGFWQLDRASQKRELLEAFAEHGGDLPVTLYGPIASVDGLRYRRVEVTGRYDPAHQLLLDNRVHNGIAGYHVLTPLRIHGSDHAVLVNRGWIPVGPSRQTVPPLPLTEAQDRVRVHGMIDLPPAKVFTLGEGEDRAPGWPKVLQQIRWNLQQRQLGYPLLPLVILLDPDAPDGFVREWHPVFMPPERHKGYAVQWFSLAGALCIIYVVVNTRRRNHRSSD